VSFHPLSGGCAALDSVADFEGGYIGGQILEAMFTAP